MVEDPYADELRELADIESDTDTLCPACAHPAIVAPRRPSVLRSVLRMKPRAAECPIKVHDVSGLGAMPCGCKDASHGS